MGELNVRVSLPVNPSEFGGIVGHSFEVCDICSNPVLLKIAYLVRGALPHIHYKEILLSWSDRFLETLISATVDEDSSSQKATLVSLRLTQEKNVPKSMDYYM